MKNSQHYEQFKEFDDLPDSAYVRTPVVQFLLGNVSRPTIWRLVKRKQIVPHKLGGSRTTTFNVGELRRFISKS